MTGMSESRSSRAVIRYLTRGMLEQLGRPGGEGPLWKFVEPILRLALERGRAAEALDFAVIVVVDPPDSIALVDVSSLSDDDDGLTDHLEDEGESQEHQVEEDEEEEEDDDGEDWKHPPQ